MGMISKRGQLVAALFIAASLVMGFAPAVAEAQETIKWRLNSSYRPDSYSGHGYQWFCDTIEKLSGGRLVIEPYFSSSLGFKDFEALSAVRKGLCEIACPVASAVAGEEPFMLMPELPFLFTDRVKEWKSLQTVLQPMTAEILHEKWGVKLLAYHGWPPRAIYAKDRITSFDDLNGYKIRTYGSAFPKIMKAWGAVPVAISGSELYTALQRGMCQGAITGLAGASEFHIWEVVKYQINVFGDVSGHSIIMVNEEAFSKLPKDLQVLVEEVGKELPRWMYVHIDEVTEPIRQQLKDHGMVFVDIEEDFQNQLVERCKPIWREFAQKSPQGMSYLKEIGKD